MRGASLWTDIMGAGEPIMTGASSWTGIKGQVSQSWHRGIILASSEQVSQS